MSTAAQRPHPNRISNIGCFFVPRRRFLSGRTTNRFLRATSIFNLTRCNAPIGPIIRRLRQGVPIVLRVSVRNTHDIGRHTKRLNVRMVAIFVTPPSFRRLRQHLVKHNARAPRRRTGQLRATGVRLTTRSRFSGIVIGGIISRTTSRL